MMTFSSLSSSNVRILAEISEGLINFTRVSFLAIHRGRSVTSVMINPFLVYGIYRADVDTKEEKKPWIDTKYPIINYFSVDLDNRYLLMDIFYPIRH